MIYILKARCVTCADFFLVKYKYELKREYKETSAKLDHLTNSMVTCIFFLSNNIKLLQCHNLILYQEWVL